MIDVAVLMFSLLRRRKDLDSSLIKIAEIFVCRAQVYVGIRLVRV